MVGYMSTASTLAIANTRSSADETPVSLGYDRIRFLGPVYFGDTITVEYRVTEIDGAPPLGCQHRDQEPGRRWSRSALIS